MRLVDIEQRHTRDGKRAGEYAPAALALLDCAPSGSAGYRRYFVALASEVTRHDVHVAFVAAPDERPAKGMGKGNFHNSSDYSG